MRCAVCGRDNPEVRRCETVSGTVYGSACRGECEALLWEAWFLTTEFGRPESEPEFWSALMLWKWKRRRAEVRGEDFTEPPPDNALDLVCREQQLLYGGVL